MTALRKPTPSITPTVDFVPPDRLARTWVGAGLATFVGIATVIALLGQTAAAMVETWWDSTTFGHRFLIVPVSAYLIWRRRAALAAVVPAPHWLGLAGMAVAALAWALGYVTGTLMVQELALVAAIQALVLTVLGWRATRLVLFPLLYLYFAVPFGEALVPHLQSITALFVVELLQRVGVPVFMDGMFISTPTGNFLVAEACAGLRYLIASMALGVLFAMIMYRAWWRRLLFVGLSVVVPIVANGIRAFGIVALAYLTDNELGVGVDHLIYGWVFFSLVTVLLLLLGMTFREPAPGDTVKTKAVALQRPARSVWAPWLATAASAVLLAAIVGYADSAVRAADDVAHASPALPVIAAPWRQVEPLAEFLDAGFRRCRYDHASVLCLGRGARRSLCRLLQHRAAGRGGRELDASVRGRPRMANQRKRKSHNHARRPANGGRLPSNRRSPEPKIDFLLVLDRR